MIKSDKDITHANLKKLHYLECVQHETMRLDGPTSGILPRIVIKDHYIKDVPISKGTAVSVNGIPNQYS